jgi:4-aminobutyrate aminotransferase/4-aminobutyrate aminotransferase/(S)-3-amino-2-methylpropionate transaminase
MNKDWWRDKAKGIPQIITPPPGPKSIKMHNHASKYIRGLSSQVKLFPVSFEEGYGITLTDVDGNRYLDFSSGIYVTSLGHSHPKISGAIAKWAHKLMNCHDFTTPIKEKVLEKMAEVLPGNLNAVQFYSDGTSAVEAGIRAARAIGNHHEFISCFRDFHGKSMAAVSLAQMVRGDVYSYGPTRAAGFYMVPRPDPYRPLFKKGDGTIDTDGYIHFYEEFIREWLCLDHWNVVPDIVTFGKSFGNGFPVTAMVVKEEFAQALDMISASSSYGGNPMACAAALASIEVIEEEQILENVRSVGAHFMNRMEKMKTEHPIIGDVKGKGFLLGIELVKEKTTKEPFDEAGKLVYQKAFRKGLAWIPAGHILRMSPPLIMDEKYADMGLDMIEESIAEVEKEFGYDS